jgi:CRP-like cAMP-binding protein
MDNKIIDYISQFIELTEDEIQIISEQNLFKRYLKNEILLSEDEYAKDCYFIIKGCVRAYHLKDGEERNTDFFLKTKPLDQLVIKPNNLQNTIYLA